MSKNQWSSQNKTRSKKGTRLDPKANKYLNKKETPVKSDRGDFKFKSNYQND